MLNILRIKYSILNNHLREIKNHVYFHLVVGLGILFVLVFGGTGFFYLLFRFLMSQEVFGPLLMDLLIGMVFLAFFSMLVFSNLIVTLTTAYISKETDFFISLPVKFKDIYMLKFIESVIYSSWAFAILSLPFFIAFAQSRNIGLMFFPLTALLVAPFVVIPAGIGGLVTMVISAYFPAKKTRTLSLALGIVVVMMSVLIVRLMGLRSFLTTSQEEQFTQIISFLNIGSLPILPNFWLTKGILAAGNACARGISFEASVPYLKDYFYWFGMLSSTSLMIILVSYWLISPLFYKGWALSRESASSTVAVSSGSIFSYIEASLFFLPRQIKSLITKDLKTFWRDPAQWTQLVILFGLLFIYVANLRNVAFQSGGLINLNFPKWKMILSFFNLAATCFIISILTTRFVYPMLSLEGKQYWIIGLAPLSREKIVWQKYWLCFFTTVILSEILIFFSNRILDVDLFMSIYGMITIFIMSFGLTGLSVGLGAATPNFKEDNPARIANGLGGTLNVIISMLYIAGSISLGIYPMTVHIFGNSGLPSFLMSSIPSANAVAQSASIEPRVVMLLLLNLLGYIIFHGLVLYLPMRIGVRRWMNIEF